MKIDGFIDKTICIYTQVWRVFTMCFPESFCKHGTDMNFLKNLIGLLMLPFKNNMDLNILSTTIGRSF